MGEAWRRYLDACEREAFRLETHQIYGVESERTEYGDFLATGRLEIPETDQWLTRVRHFRETGRWIGRVHVVRRPLTSYLEYEFAVYDHTVRAGEDVRILDVTDGVDHGLPSQDFWLLDETSVVHMDYAADGTQVGRELLEDVDPAQYVSWKRIALDLAEPFVTYRTNQRA